MRIATMFLITLGVAACGSDAPAPDHSVEAAGDYQVGTTRIATTDATRTRDLALQVWYPTETAAADVPIEMLEPDALRAQYAALLASAPPACPGRTAHVALDAAVTGGAGPFPLVAYSHCHDGTRLSSETTAERLASHGFIVVAVDHTGNTLWEHLANPDADAQLNEAELDVRTADVRFALDAVEADARWSGAIDADRVGVFGHSFGGVTAGLVAETDPRIKSAAALAAPMDNPLIQGVTLANIDLPLMFGVMEEDNSIGLFGNQLIDDNYHAAVGPKTWQVQLANAGHWSVSDLDGLVEPLFAPGCGDAMRQTGDGSAFTYLDPATARGIVAAYITAFFAATLNADAGAEAYLDGGFPADTVTSEHR